MAAAEFDVLLRYLRALADETRLKIISLVSNRAYQVGELADILNLTEPTVSHHLTKLREIGLLNLSTVGTKHYYRLNTETLDIVKRFMSPEEMEHFNEFILSRETAEELYRKKASQQREQSEAWLDSLGLDEESRKVFKDYTANGRLKQIPTQQKKLMVILHYLAAQFEPGRKYSEREVNAIIERFYEDYATLRRELIDFHLLEREPGGSLYWRA
jgi:predicted transcriptional regulator